MINQTQPEIIEVSGWPFRIQYPPNPSPEQRVMLLLHGHLGNENVMWVLTKPIPRFYYFLAPRAPVKLGENQFSWHAIGSQWLDLQAYKQLADDVLYHVDQWIKDQKIDKQKIDIMGFSQGAVMAYAIAILYPERVRRIAALAGFIPHAWLYELNPPHLSDLSLFIAHGSKDDVIPIKKSYQAADWFKKNGAQVTFCEADIGHKLSSNCFKGLGEFFS